MNKNCIKSVLILLAISAYTQGAPTHLVDEKPVSITRDASGVILMSGSSAVITDNVGGSLDLGGGSGAVTFTIGDARNQPMPAGTSVTLESDNGEILGAETIATPCSSFDGPLTYTFVLNSDDTPDSKAALLTVTTPGPGLSGIQGTTTTYFINVSDIPPPP